MAKRHSLLRRITRGIAKATLYLFLFVLIATAALLVGLETAPGRRLAANQVNALLRPLFKGEIEIQRIGHLSIFGVAGVDARILAADGSQAVLARGVRATISPTGLLASLVGKGDLDIAVSGVRIDYADASLDSDPQSNLKIATAFEPREPSTPTNEPPGRQVNIHLAPIELTHAWVHGSIEGAPPIDVDVEDARAAVHVVAVGTTITLSQLALRTRALPSNSNLVGNVHSTIEIPSATDKPLKIAAAFEGTAHAIPLSASAALEGKKLDTSLVIPTISRDQARAAIPEFAVNGPLSLTAETHGELPTIDIAAKARVGNGEMRANASLAFGDLLSGTLSLALDQIDLHAITEEAPPSSLSMQSNASLNGTKDGALGGTFTVSLARGVIAKNDIPRVNLNGTFSQRKEDRSKAGGGIRVKANATIDEAGAPTSVHLDLHPLRDFLSIDWGVHASAPRLRDVRRLPQKAEGSAVVDVEGRLDLTSPPKITAKAAAMLEGVSYESVQLESVHIETSAEGSLGNATLPALKETRVSAVRRGATLTATVERLGFSNGIDIKGATLEGAGRFSADAHISPASVDIKADGDKIDLRSIAAFAGQSARVKAGTLSLHVDMNARRDGAEGVAQISLENGAFAEAPHASARIDIAAHERRLDGTVHIAGGDFGTLDLTNLHVHVGGEGPLAISSWKKAWGSVDMDGQVDLTKIAPLLPKEATQNLDLAGRVIVDGKFLRKRSDDFTPSIRLALRTAGLRIAAKERPPTIPQRTWGLSGVDAQLDVLLDGTTGSTEIAARAVDPRGALVAANFKSNDIPYASLINDTAHALSYLEKTPFSAAIDIPSRDLQTFPAFLQPGGVGGEVEGRIEVRGTAFHPFVDVAINGRKLRVDDLGATRLDTTIVGKYDGEIAEISIEANSPREKVADASARVSIRIDDLVKAQDEFPWEGSAKASLSRFPLGSLAPLAARQVRGRISGNVELTGLHKDAKLTANVQTENLRVGSVMFPTGTASLSIDDKQLDGALRLIQTDGQMKATAVIPVRWGAAITPGTDPAREARFSLQAKQLRAALAEPFVENTISELEGRVDADAELVLREHQKPEMHGSVTLTQGLFQAVAGGGEFHDVTGRVALATDGTLRLDGVEAKGVTGRLTVEGEAKLDGFSFRDAGVTVKIEKKEAVPMVLEGNNLGSIAGTFALKASSAEDQSTTAIQLDIPEALVELRPSFSRSIEDLDEPEATTIGVRTANRQFVSLPLGPPREEPAPPKAGEKPKELKVAVSIGKDVEVRRGNQIRLFLTGNPSIRVREKATAAGQILITSGKLDVKGKAFEIEKGTVTFAEDPSNPVVAITAKWDAPDGTHVYADVLGPAKTLSTKGIKLRSEPSRPINEILALILFGSASGSSSTPYAQKPASAGSQAGTFVGGAATEGLSQGFDDLTGIQASAKIDTSSSTNPRPEVEIQIARDISLQIAYVLGTIPPGTNFDRTYVTVAWRFVTDWSLETTIGDRGSSFADLIWEYRY